MKKIIVGLMIAFLFIGCSSKGSEEVVVEPKLVVGKSLDAIVINDQFEKPQTIDANTKKVIFAFSKDVAHTCNDYFVTQEPTYLSENKTQFIADVSAAPSLIRSIFILPGLKDFKHTVLILDDKKIAASFRSGVDVEKIVIVYLENKIITSIRTINSADELKNIILTN
ncbi:hypothetical protein [Sulfurimonas sp.]|uniref:hypothetical protein n=1 Tax=Sulfurimonas sp. TaxID=2022749 RepID=UPI002B48D3F5|nr:hypothetical protein [Sulfurimonas sp.]